MTMQNLVAHNIPLTGKHLIEASAGTGKTFNITRIYLRMLLERKLSVEQILVMTFTKDATQELRGRIDTFIRQAINNWSTLVIKDPYFIAIAEHIEEEEAIYLLRKALLFLDEAAIFTIHGFCKRVLNQHAFASGLAFNAQMEANCQDVILESCQDWYRSLALQSVDDFLLLAEFWPEPDGFLNNFSKALGQQNELDVIDVESIIEHFQRSASTALQSLRMNNETLLAALVDVKKGQDRQNRIDELNALLIWLEQISQDGALGTSLSMPDAFIDGRRFSKSKFKTGLIEMFLPVNEVKTLHKDLAKTINKAKAFAIVRQGIYHIRQEVKQKKQSLSMLDFDDLISTLAERLTSKENELAELLFQQFPVALVDEFQDTDPQQFSILKAIYYHQNNAALYMIGDPKQAIYGFRGGDVFAYLSARADCQYQWLMDTNWRSTVEMIQGYNRLFYGASLNDEGKNVFGYDIPYSPVNSPDAALKKDKPGLNEDHFNALQFIHFINPEPETKSGKASPVKQSFRPVMADWCADEIVRLLTSHQEVSSQGNKALNAQDIAILVRDGSEARAIKQALHHQGLASVFLSNRANLFHSTQTQQLLSLLKAVLFVENERLYIAGLACDLLGYSPEKLYQLQQDELAWQSLKFTFIALRDEWLYKGFISMALKLMHEHFAIAEQDQDRVLTNLLHLFELLQAASQRYRQPQELLFWFEQQSKLDNPESESELRLESDDDLIRIITQHGSKGLEYPIVFVPFATRHKDPLKFGNRAVNFIEYHDPKGKLCLSLDGSTQAKAAMAEEAYAESIRLLYVAVTRAEQRCYILTTGFENSHQSPLGQTLKWQTGTNIEQSLSQLVQDNPQDIALSIINADIENDAGNSVDNTIINQSLLYQGNKNNNFMPKVATFNAKIERDWWLSSFSALSKNLRHGGVSVPDRDTEGLLNAQASSQESGLLTVQHNQLPSNVLRFNLAKGAHSGNLLHDILEHTDFTAPDWHQAMHWPLSKYGELTKGFTEQDLQQWLKQVLDTPLLCKNLAGELVNNALSLSMIATDKSLRESEFYYPMNSASSDTLAKLLTEHRNNYTDENSEQSPNETITKRQTLVKLPAYQTLKGMMHGFIDLVFEADGKYYVCDYKSSYLGDGFSDYNQENLLLNIEKNHYDLQYLIYSLALHRYLRTTLPDYQVEQHLGGVFYLYLRGMTADVQHRNAGVYHRKITVAEINKLDQLFSGGSVDV
jgi:exodeoxyribonuclease V beta subunit